MIYLIPEAVQAGMCLSPTPFKKQSMKIMDIIKMMKLYYGCIAMMRQIGC